MKKRLIIVCGVLTVSALVVTCSHINEIRLNDFTPTPETIEEAKRYFELGDQYQKELKFDLAAEAHNKAIEIAGKKVVGQFLRDRYVNGIKQDDQAHTYLLQGDQFVAQGKYTDALNAYNESYSIGGLSRAVSGLELAETYEKLGRYNEGINHIDEMISKGYLSQSGIERANEIKARMTSAKNKITSSSAQ